MQVTGRFLPDQLTEHPFGVVLGQYMSDQEAMSLAVQLAWCGVGSAQPNPLVGAVLLDANGRLKGYGHHEACGSHHAEINALNMFEASKSDISELRGGTFFVTLEPCAHQGRTPPCSERLAALPLRRVVIGSVDPTSKVNGKGIAILEAAGITVERSQYYRAECQQLIERFVASHHQQRLFVGMKAACDLGGKIAERGDKRHWITGPRARAYGHFLRLVYDGIVVGAETVVCDNPTLMPTATSKPDIAPWRIVLDPTGRAAICRDLKSQNLWQQAASKVVWMIDPARCIAHARAALGQAAVRVVEIESMGGSFSPKTVLKALYDLGLTSVLLEGGAGLYGSFLENNLVDRLHVFRAPVNLAMANPIKWFDHWHGYDESKIRVSNQYQLDQDVLLECLL